MKQIFLSFIVLSLSSFTVVYSDFSWNTALNSGSQTFSKPSWANSLQLYEDYVINPFKSSTIIKNTTCVNGVCSTSNYTVDGRIFNASHPLYKRYWEVRKNWSEESSWISTYINYRENTYTTESWWVLKPNQSVTVRKYYSVTYKHDTSTPTCWEVKYYNDESLTIPFTYWGWWLNHEKYYTMICKDSQTWCFCSPDDTNCIISWGEVVSTPQLLGHNIRPSVSFTNNVNLTDTSCQPSWGLFQKILYDLKTPKLEMNFWTQSLNVNIETNRDYEILGGKKLDGVETPGELVFSLTPELDKKVGETDISFDVEDLYLSSSVHGVSGIKSYNFKILRHTDRSFQSLGSSQELLTCGIEKNFPEYNPDGSVSITDSYSESISCDELLKTWKYSLILIALDWAWNKTELTVPLNVYPDVLSVTNSTVVTADSRNKYANHSDIYTYELTLRDTYMNPLFNRKIDSIDQNIEGYSLWKEISTQDGDDALDLSMLASTTDNEGKILFQLSSLRPGEYTQRFKLEFQNWWKDYIQDKAVKTEYLLNIFDNEFLKPFIANITLLWPGTVPELWVLQKYQIDLNNIGWITSISNAKLSINNSTIDFDTAHDFDAIVNKDEEFTIADPICSFEGSINALSESDVLSWPVLAPKNLPISYTIWWETVEYTLDEFSIVGCDKTTLWLKTIWNIQWIWKGGLTGQKENFSNLSQSSLRSDIQRNAINLIKWMNSGEKVNNIYYVEWDVSIGGEISDYETIIVRNGNIFIESDLYATSEKLGLIAIKDSGYDEKNDFNSMWNIYIWKNVENITANVYADGALRSAKSDGTSYTDGELSKKLHLLWTIFTRNTIWWAVNTWTDFILPGWSTTTDVNLAKVYDLNYIRKSDICGDDYSFLIEYNPKFQLNPPIGFFVK